MTEKLLCILEDQVNADLSIVMFGPGLYNGRR